MSCVKIIVLIFFIRFIHFLFLGMLKSSSSSIFDVPQEKALVESYIDLKQNTFKESSIFYGPKKTDTTSKEITVINNFTSIEFNNSQPGLD